jgi:eukaryotic-like serine/threonine-protein kinase
VGNDIREDRPDDAALLELASMIDEDQPIDWESEEGVARDAAERAVLAELRLLAALTRVYRDPDGTGGDTVMDVPGEAGRVSDTWGSLTILEPVGRGGFAKVFRARDALGRNVALKLFPETRDNAAALATRVLREGSLLAKVSHRNVVVVHGVERAKGCVGLWMEFIHGRTMEDELRARGPLSAEEAMPIGVDLCRALAAVHGRGLVHRDVKATNVMREEGGRTVLMDFGAGTELDTGARRSLDMAGTPLYLAPELFDGTAATRASDIYSLGVLLYRMVTRSYPVEGADRTEIERAHREGRVMRLRDVRPDLPGEFVQAVERALSPDPSARPQTAGEFEAALTSRAAPSVPSWTWWQRAAAIAAALVLIAVPVTWFVASQTGGPDSANPSSAAAVEPATPAAAATPSYTVQARMFRTRDGVESQLMAGTELAVGDRVSLRIEASREIYVYVLNVDDTGKSFRLFPLPDHRPDNPLMPSKEHRLPGDVGVDWSVDSAGGREHFVIMVNPVRVDAVEALVRSIPAAAEGRAAAAITTDGVGVLRSVGGLARDKTVASTGSPALLWFEEASDLTGQQETANGAWMRRLTVPGASRR